MMRTSEIHAIPYNRAGAALRRAIADLQHRAAPEVSAPPGDVIAPEHAPELDALSFYLAEGDRVISYAGVVHIPIQHADQGFLVAGLSCVATDPAYQRRGLGARVVAAATQAILDSTADLGLFTCDPPLVPFYTRAGGWSPASDVVLIGSRYPGALTSLLLQKAVLLRLVSERARRAAPHFARATIDLGLPLGHFI